MPGIVPNRLFFSRLPTDELELSCIVTLPALAQNGSISWVLRTADDSNRSVTCEWIVGADAVAHGRTVLSAVLPADWSDSILAVDTGGGYSEHEVHRFQQHQRFGLPFDRDVLVAGGHRLGEAHRVAFDLPAQQFGWDLVPLRPGDLALLSAQMSTPPRSADLACYGRKVLSPASGVVVSVVDGIPDAELLGQQQQIPAGASIAWAAGNHVIIRHDNDVHSCMAHLQAGTISVCEGDQLQPGTVVGAVGSSGNVTGPHLHLHFMDGPDLLNSAPLPVELTAEGGTYAPTSGQIIGPG